MRLALFLAILHASPALASQRVIGGNPADVGEWPDTVAIKTQGYWGCTGTLVAPRVVFTAGHCNQQISEVLVNSTNYADGSQGEVIGVVAAYEYPNSWQNYDFTVLVLEQDASVAPRTVATSCVIDNHLRDGATVAPVGFGSTETWGGGSNSLLMEARTTVTDHDCSESRRGCNDSVRPEGELIAGGGGIDSCNGDSGGPLYLETPDGWFLVGITSRAAQPASAACGDGGIYVRADAVIDWAEEQTGLSIQRPDCDTVSPAENQPPAPIGGSLDLDQGATATLQIDANDPDAGQAHSFTVLTAPEWGTASVDTSGLLTYTAPTDVFGTTTVDIEVVDNGTPAASGLAEVTITVREVLAEDSGLTDSGDGGDDDIDLAPGGCSCDSSGSPASWLGFATLAVLLRRRRTTR